MDLRRLQRDKFGVQIPRVIHPQVYTAYKMMPVIREIRVAMRTTQDPRSLVEIVRKSIAGIDRAVPVFQIQTLSEELFDSVAPRRFNLALLAIFAASALLLALIGIYGVIAYLVAQRTTEIGIRMALGASRHSILRLVVRQGMSMILTGIVVGLLSAAGASRAMSNMLYDVRPGDAATFVSVSAVIMLTALAACIGPALRAALLDPIRAMK